MWRDRGPQRAPSPNDRAWMLLCCHLTWWIRSAFCSGFELKKPNRACRTSTWAVAAVAAVVTFTAQEGLCCPSAMCLLLTRTASPHFPVTAGACSVPLASSFPWSPFKCWEYKLPLALSQMRGCTLGSVCQVSFSKRLTRRLLPQPRDICYFHHQLVLQDEPFWFYLRGESLRLWCFIVHNILLRPRTSCSCSLVCGYSYTVYCTLHD